MNPTPLISADGRWSFDPLDLARCGYQSTGRRYPSGYAGIGRAQELAHEFDVTMGSLQSFRTGPVGSETEWEFFFTPDRKDGFCGSPLMPPGTWTLGERP